MMNDESAKSFQLIQHLLYTGNIESDLLFKGGWFCWHNLPFNIFQPFRRIALGAHDSLGRFDINHYAIL